MFSRRCALALLAVMLPCVAWAQAPAAPAPPAKADTAAADPAYNAKLRDIEERVNELKEKVFQSKARLIQLQEVVLHGAISGAKLVLVHKNEMGGTFRLARLQYALDGAPVYSRAASGDELQALHELEVFNGSVAPGNHQLSVYIEYQGNGYGVFSYLKDYTFKVKSSQTVVVEEGKLTTVHIVGFEKGNLTTELKDRPAVRYEVDAGKPIAEEKKRDTPAPAPAAAPQGGKTP